MSVELLYWIRTRISGDDEIAICGRVSEDSYAFAHIFLRGWHQRCCMSNLDHLAAIGDQRVDFLFESSIAPGRRLAVAAVGPKSTHWQIDDDAIEHAVSELIRKCSLIQVEICIVFGALAHADEDVVVRE
ncbi:hypothetical protein C451_19633 [Halococcus thailandensis JCM 13552]|uniref:Uncharacterized protein n=1 Tax=Halococcus thailandensis JCM 13552 TaxID=1227457 RepID=M0MVZ0_9EURY|nr:hypothetical protein C451_19633 [Halococcus thailandensis JCM 13552]